MLRLFHGMALVLLLTESQLGLAAEGGVSLGQTRVIFSAADSAQSITVINSGEGTYLIHARVQTTPDVGEAAPFIVTPPLYSLKGGDRQLLRILRQDAALPADRESLFYLAVAAIPSQPAQITARDRVSVGVRFVVKLFYRPEGLISPAEETACQLAFRREANGVRISNPTAFFQTLGQLTINGRALALAQQPVMVPPLQHIVLSTSEQPATVSWQTLTDYGGLSAPCSQTSVS